MFNFLLMVMSMVNGMRLSKGFLASICVACAPAIFMVGCASTMNHDYMDMVQVPVSTSPPGATLVVDGREYISPDFVWVPRGMGDITMSVEKEGYQSVNVIFRQSQDTWAWGNVVAGGPIGLGTDYLTEGIYTVIPQKVHLKLTDATYVSDEEETRVGMEEARETAQVEPLLPETSGNVAQEPPAGGEPQTLMAQESDTDLPEEKVETPVLNDKDKEAENPAPELPSEQPKEFAVQDIYFDYDSAKVSQESQYLLEKTARWLKDQSSTHVTIEGHSDDRGTNRYNLVLGRKRAMAIRSYLIDLGVDPARLTVVGLGEERPSCRIQTEACYQRNRRAHFVFQHIETPAEKKTALVSEKHL